MERFITLARIVRTRGIKGEVSADLLTDFPERFASLNQVRVLCRGKEYEEEIESYWFHQNRVVLKFRNRDTPEVAQELVSGEIQIAESEREPLPEGAYYDTDLIDCLVLENQAPVGRVIEIFRTGPGNTNLVLRNDEGKELMVPFAQEFLIKVDVENKLIEMRLPEGLKEL